MLTNGNQSNVSADDIAALYGFLSIEEREQLDALLLQSAYDWQALARPNQLAPAGDWVIWLILAGRGFGKTRSVCEWLRARVENGEARRIGIIAPTAADYRDILVLGESGLINSSPPWNKPSWNPSKRSITWANGAEALCFSSSEPESLRGYQFDTLVCDELGSWKYQEQTWDMAQFGLRLGKAPKCVIATTPKPHPLIKRLTQDPTCIVTRGSTYENKDNLAAAFLNAILGKYEGTRLGRQEIYAEILEDVEGAIWNRDWIEDNRHKEAPELIKVVVGVDPSGSVNGNECGIVVAGMDKERQFYVLADYSILGTANEWANAVVDAYNKFGADSIIAERNYGGDMVQSVIANASDSLINIKMVTATRGKAVRAEPVAALYEQGKVHHVGNLSALEDELTSWVPGESKNSPNRLDALVWAITALSGRQSTVVAY
jgi:phage terminase large subunit-like protein